MMNIRNLGSKESLGVKFKEVTLDPRIIGGVGIIGGLDIVIIINNRGGGGWNNRGVRPGGKISVGGFLVLLCLYYRHTHYGISQRQHAFRV